MTSAVCCPVCGSTESIKLLEYSAAQAAQHFCTETRDTDRNYRLRRCLERLWPDGCCAVYTCRACTFGYGWPHTGGDEEFYSILHEAHGYPSDRWEYRAVMARFAADGKTRQRKALDIGAGVGAFLTRLGPSWQAFAVEGSETTRTVLSEKSINVFTSLGDIKDEQFSLITLFQVLEHLDNFKSTLSQCRNLIDPAGRLVISVPDGQAMIEQERVIGWPDMPPNHINKWTPGSLTRALGDAGFAVEEVVFERPSLSAVKGAVHMRVLANAGNPRSVGAMIYRVKNRWQRIALLPLAAVGPLVRLLLFHWRYLLKGGSFLVIARPVSDAVRGIAGAPVPASGP